MDVGLYRDEQFAFSSSAYTEYYSSDSAGFSIDQDDIFEEIRPMPHPPNEIFEWHSDDTEKEAKCDLVDNQSVTSLNEISISSKDELHALLGIQNWNPSSQPELHQNLEQAANHINYIAEKHIHLTNSKAESALQEMLNFPRIANVPHINLADIKIEANELAEELSEHNLDACNNYRRESESSDILNTSLSSTELTNFDIAEYVFEEDKQTKKSIYLSEVKIEPKHVKNEPGRENKHVGVKTGTRFPVRAGMKKIDLKARKYIVDSDTKKSFSEDECDVDIETVSEEESSPILEAGNLSDLLEQFEATEVKNNEQSLTTSYQVNNCQKNLSLNVKVQIKSEKKEIVNNENLDTSFIKKEPKIENRRPEITKAQHIKQDKVEPVPVKAEQGTIDIPKPQIQQGMKEVLYINNLVQSKTGASVQDATTSSKTPNATSNRQILDSLPQELINRIKESGKRKPITVIQPIPNNRKKSKIQETTPTKAVPSPSSEAVYLDHNYCSIDSNVNNKFNKKDSGFGSSEEDDRAVISRQPTVKNADGTLMVSLLKANTIRQVDTSKCQKKKLNLEEYKKRRNGLITPKNNSLNPSPNTSSSTSPVPEDEHEKMLKHQEKLRRMAQELLKTAPKSEKKLEEQPSLIKVPKLIPMSPVLTSQPSSPVINKETQVKTEIAVKTEIQCKTEELSKVNSSVKPKVEVLESKPVEIIPPKVPPNLERKILVSFGVNTDFRIAKNEDPLAPVEKLQEIKPLLEKASNKISENSLIASVIENIPKVIGKEVKENSANSAIESEEVPREHGEFKQVIYLEKDRAPCETKDAETQTNISLIEQTKRGRIRRRVSSSSSCSSYKSKEFSRRSRKNSCSSSSSRSSVSSRSSTSSRSSEYSSRNSSRLSYSRSRSRSRSPKYIKRRRTSSAERDHLNAVEERRIIYVGRISTGTTKEDLRRKFQKFGPINKISLHFRDIGENYGFVTFKYKEDAHEAYEHGNDDPSYPCYKISFGGRREFCKAAYSDLDNMREDAYYQSQTSGDSYDKLLKEAMEKLKKRKV